MMKQRQKGFSLIEILVSIVLASIGALGFISLQLHMQSSELETIQREEATRQLNFIVGQIKANRDAFNCYVLSEQLAGPDLWVGNDYAEVYACNVAGTLETQTQVVDDISNWDEMLKGSLVTLNGLDAGGMIGARGCISRLAVGSDTLLVEIAWQGSQPSGVSASTCASGQYGNDNLRRIISTEVRVANFD